MTKIFTRHKMKKKITKAFCFILYTKSLGISGHFRDDNLDTYGSSHLVGSEIRKKKTVVSRYYWEARANVVRKYGLYAEREE